MYALPGNECTQEFQTGFNFFGLVDRIMSFCTILVIIMKTYSQSIKNGGIMFNGNYQDDNNIQSGFF